MNQEIRLFIVEQWRCKMREVARKLFMILYHCPVDHKYFVLNDGNYFDSFYADSDQDAIAKLGW